jgi:hypothetical protein
VPKRNIYRDGARVYREGTRVFKHSRKFVNTVVPAVMKPARTLWHELLGFIFILMAIAFVFSGLRAVREFDGTPGAVIRLVLLGFGVCLLGGYGISSFLRARKISRS